VSPIRFSTVAQADIAAWFDKYGPAVYRRARYLLGNHEDAQEATQEIFIRAMKSASSFEGRAGEYTWLSRITTNFCLNRIRDQRRRDELLQEKVATLPGSFPATPSAEGLLTMRKLLAEADEECARAAIYVFVDGMSHREAAELLDVSRRTVGNLIEKFRHWAAERLADDERMA